MLVTLEGMDHVVVAVRDLDASAAQWRGLGFTVSPPGAHSAHMGTGNHTIMFVEDYLELLGILQETDLNAPMRAFIDRHGEGIERIAFTTTDAATGVAALRANGIEATGPVEFSRPVDLPDGRHGEASFSTFQWPVDVRPADLRIFACQHHTRDSVWIPSLQAHANTACGIKRIELVTPEPAEAAALMAKLIVSEVLTADGPAVLVPTVSGRGGFLFMTHESFLARHPSVKREELPTEGAAALVLRVNDLAAAARAVGPDAIVSDESVTIPPGRANGVTLVFVPK